MSGHFELKSQSEEAVAEVTADDTESNFQTEDGNVESETKTAKVEELEERTELAEAEVVVPSGKKKAQNKNVNVWGDSALIEAWECAVREYQEYHSPNASKAWKKTISASQQTPSRKSIPNNDQRLTDTDPPKSQQPKAAVSGKEPAKQNTSTGLPESSTATTPLKNKVEKKEVTESKTDDQNMPQQGATGYPYPYSYPYPYPYPYPPASSWGYDPNYAYYYSQQGDAPTPNLNQNAAEATTASAAPPTLPLDAQVPEMKSTPPVPNLAGIDDENLSNVIMAWYFAGYYTGLYQANKK